MIMMGEHDAVIEQVQLINIHGSMFYDLLYRHEGESDLRRARLGVEEVYEKPQPGDAISVSYLMGVATRVVRR